MLYQGDGYEVDYLTSSAKNLNSRWVRPIFIHPLQVVETDMRHEEQEKQSKEMIEGELEKSKYIKQMQVPYQTNDALTIDPRYVKTKLKTGGAKKFSFTPLKIKSRYM